MVICQIDELLISKYNWLIWLFQLNVPAATVVIERKALLPVVIMLIVMISAGCLKISLQTNYLFLHYVSVAFNLIKSMYFYSLNFYIFRDVAEMATFKINYSQCFSLLSFNIAFSKSYCSVISNSVYDLSSLSSILNITCSDNVFSC